MVNVNLAGKKKATEQEASSEEEVYEDVPTTAAAEIRAGETNTYKYITVNIDLDQCVRVCVAYFSAHIKATIYL